MYFCTTRSLQGAAAAANQICTAQTSNGGQAGKGRRVLPPAGRISTRSQAAVPAGCLHKAEHRLLGGGDACVSAAGALGKLDDPVIVGACGERRPEGSSIWRALERPSHEAA